MENVILKSESGFSVQILTLGGIITEIMAKDAHGKRENVVLNYEQLEDYLSNPLFLGCIVGPVAGRTKDGIMPIGESLLKLDVSEHPNSLHSGKNGLHNVIWTKKSHTQNQVVLTYKSKPLNAVEGELNYTLTYTVSGETLTMDLFATSSNETYLSLTNHSYFNLSGSSDQSILDHHLALNCSHYALIDHESLPTKLDVYVNSESHIGSIIKSMPQIFSDTFGIDHPFKCASGDFIAHLNDPISGRSLRVSTTQPYVIIYSGNFLHTATSPSGKLFKKYSGICFETQDLPNVVNNKLDTVHFVTPDLPYRHQTVFDFSILQTI